MISYCEKLNLHLLNVFQDSTKEILMTKLTKIQVVKTKCHLMKSIMNGLRILTIRMSIIIVESM